MTSVTTPTASGTRRLILRAGRTSDGPEVAHDHWDRPRAGRRALARGVALRRGRCAAGRGSQMLRHRVSGRRTQPAERTRQSTSDRRHRRTRREAPGRAAWAGLSRLLPRLRRPVRASCRKHLLRVRNRQPGPPHPAADLERAVRHRAHDRSSSEASGLVVTRRRLGAGRPAPPGRLRPLLHDSGAPSGPGVPVTCLLDPTRGPVRRRLERSARLSTRRGSDRSEPARHRRRPRIPAVEERCHRRHRRPGARAGRPEARR
jgi:hypothetical protein